MTSRILPSRLTIQAFVNGVPLPAAWITVTLPMKAKNPYRLLFGPASHDGTIIVTREDLLHEIKKIQNLFVMDYADPTVAWTGAVEVRPVNRSDIANVLIAFDIYQDSDVYPRDLSTQLTELDVRLGDFEGGRLTLTGSVDGLEEGKLVLVGQDAD